MVPLIKKKFIKWILLSACVFGYWQSGAHPMPSSVVNLFILENSIKGEAKIPLVELQNAIGEQQYNNINSSFFRNYFVNHIAAVSGLQKWITVIDSLSTFEEKDPIVGNYKEVLVYFELRPPANESLRKFTFYYDAVIHQVVTHKILIYVQQDWFNGIQNENKVQQIGIIHLDIPTGQVSPLEVSLEKGSWWKGFKSTIELGMQHIKEGTDHLLFLLVLLLPSMLLIKQKHWGKFGGTRYSLIRLLKIVTSFTIGHSVTLLIGASGWLKLPSQPVEILIAFSILVSAIHAVYPIFPGKEIYIAAGFGLVHGLAFATVLSNLKPGAGAMALSILGFNLGIELMQLFIIAIIIPWLLVLSQPPAYKWFRVTGALLAAIAALAWIAERSSGKENFITTTVIKATQYGWWFIIALAAASIVVFYSGYRFRKHI